MSTASPGTEDVFYGSFFPLCSTSEIEVAVRMEDSQPAAHFADQLSNH